MAKDYIYLLTTQEANKLPDIEVVEFEIHKLDMTTKLHQIKVAQLCQKIGEKLRLSKEELSDLVQAAKLHDIGKMGVPFEILNKPDKLTRDEYNIIKAHPEMGVEILKNSNMVLSEKVVELVRNHHETLDGEGYPRGLKGEKLDKLCRILTVADKYEALTAKRPYKEYIDMRKTFQILKEDVNNGKIDATVVQALNEVVKEKTLLQDTKRDRGIKYEVERLN